MRIRKCQSCKLRNANFITRKDRLSEKSTNFFCKLCFHDLHDGFEEGSANVLTDKVSDPMARSLQHFEVYKYIHD